jgi:hypothetical protein
MNNRLIIVFLIIILISSFLYSQNVQEAPWSNCNFSKKTFDGISKWLNKSMNERSCLAVKSFPKSLEIGRSNFPIQIVCF